MRDTSTGKHSFCTFRPRGAVRNTVQASDMGSFCVRFMAARMSVQGCKQELRELGDAVGVVSRGASSSVIQALPLARYIAAEDNIAATKGKYSQFASQSWRGKMSMLNRPKMPVSEDKAYQKARHFGCPVRARRTTGSKACGCKIPAEIIDFCGQDSGPVDIPTPFVGKTPLEYGFFQGSPPAFKAAYVAVHHCTCVLVPQKSLL